MELKKISKEELREKLELHRKWLSGEEGGVKLDLRNVDLRCANLRSVNLSYAKLRNSNLRYADLRYSDLRYSNLRYSYLRYADLTNANLEGADLIGTDLRNANLINADLSLANLSYADLSYANLYEADLSKTEFYPTNLYKTKSNFVGVENIGSRNDTTHYFYNDNRIICGCFDGTMEEFKNKVKETYEESSKEYKQYMIAIDTLKKLAELEGEK